jgi:hypothetical protein
VAPAAPPPQAKQSTKVPAAKSAAPDLLTRIKAIPAAVIPATERVLQSARAVTSSISPHHMRLVWASVAAVILVAIATAFFLTRGPAPTGVLVIDAVPWATVTGLQAEDGTAQTLPESATTPLSLSVPAGTYQVTLTGPPPESKATTVTMRVEVDGVAVVPVTRFQTMTAEQYFEPYLGSSTATSSAPPESAPAPGPGAAGTPPVAAPSGTGGSQ